jgi:DNA replication initiation complex subunit (GINS family)
MISYADIDKAFRQERANPTLQKLPPEFYDEARRLADSPEVTQYRDTILDYTNQVFSSRCNKIVLSAARAGPQTRSPENALHQEARLYQDILEAVAKAKADMMDAKPEIPASAAPAPLKPPVKVRIRQALPAIVGSDSREYGPFREDDVVELPDDSAGILLAKGVAERL